MSAVNTSETGTTPWSQAATFRSSAENRAPSHRPAQRTSRDRIPPPRPRPPSPADEPYEKRWLALGVIAVTVLLVILDATDRQHRPAGRLGRPGHRRGHPAVDRHRLHADVRRLPAARRADRRLLGPQAHVPGGRGRLRGRVGPRRPRPERGHAVRRPRAPGRLRRAAGARPRSR